MKILVTGGCGFIGSNFVNYVMKKRHNFSVVVVDSLTYAGNYEYIKKNEKSILFDFIKADINDYETMEQIFSVNKFDTVINFAAETSVDKSFKDPDLFMKTNYEGVLNLVKLSKKYHIKRFHQVSTDEVYGSSRFIQFKESSTLFPTNPYSKSKAKADAYLMEEYKTNNFPVTISRSTNNYGPNQKEDKLIPLVIKCAVENKKIPIYGDGNYYRDWIYVMDHCIAIETILRYGKVGQIYNVGTNKLVSNIKLVKKILDILNKSYDMIKFVEDREIHDYAYSVSTKKIRSELGWHLNYDYNQSLEETVSFYLCKFQNKL